MDSNLGLNAGTGVVSILSTLYIVNNQIKPIKDDVNRLVGDVGEMIQQKEDIDQVKNDIKELMSLYSDREKKLLVVIDRQEEHIQFLTKTVMDIQVGVYRELKLETKPMPSEFLPNRMTNGTNTDSYRGVGRSTTSTRGVENDSNPKTTQRDYDDRDYDDRDYDRPKYESNHREYDYQRHFASRGERSPSAKTDGFNRPVGRSSSERLRTRPLTGETKNYTNGSRREDTRDTRYAVRDKVRRDDSGKSDVMSRINALVH